MILLKPSPDADQAVWNQYGLVSCLYLKWKLERFLPKQFNYKGGRVNRCLGLGLGSTVKAEAPKYDLYFRMFPTPEAGWPRETLVIARIIFKEERKGHGRSLLRFLAKLASEIGYHYIAIEATNDDSKAFSESFGINPINNGANCIGSVDDVRRALERPT